MFAKYFNAPELNASHPNQRKNKPTQAFSGFPIGSESVPLSYRCNLGPSMMAAARADAPPSKWTGPDPAMSTTPKFLKESFYNKDLSKKLSDSLEKSVFSPNPAGRNAVTKTTERTSFNAYIVLTSKFKYFLHDSVQ